MKKPNWFTSRLELFNAILIAVVSLTTAFAVWQTNVVGSNAADEGRLGLINAVKKQAFANEDERQLYQEAGFAFQYAVQQAEVQVLEASNDPASQARAANLKQYLLPNLQLLASPLASDSVYQKSDGTYDLQKRLDSIRGKQGLGLDPQASFKRADSFYAEQRWLVIGSILLAISLFWLALVEISKDRWRVWEFLIGALAYLVGLVWFLGVEGIFFLARGG
ncbi:MAG: hypothetical protein M1282_14100 [Chloroflexi bacterium]|nr:hypothetical protein [Chloroflexota bacterium]